jgi:hypothetical protein
MIALTVRTSLAARSKLEYAGTGLDHMVQQWAHVRVQKNPEKTSSGLHGLRGLLILHLIQNACVAHPRRHIPRARAAERSLEPSNTVWSTWAKRSMWSKRPNATSRAREARPEKKDDCRRHYT